MTNDSQMSSLTGQTKELNNSANSCQFFKSHTKEITQFNTINFIIQGRQTSNFPKSAWNIKKKLFNQQPVYTIIQCKEKILKTTTNHQNTQT